MSNLYRMAPAPRSAREALADGLRLWFLNWRSVLPVAFVGWAPGQIGCMSALVLPLAPGHRLLLSLLSIGLSLLGACFVSAAVVGMLAGAQGPAGAVRVGLRRMAGVVRTQVLLLCLLLLVLLPAIAGLSLLFQRGVPALALFFCTAPMASLLCLRCSLAPTAAAADEPGLSALRRSAALSGDRLEDLLTFGLLCAVAMAPLLLLSFSGWLLPASRGLLLLSQGIGLCTSFLLSLQGQGAAVGLALLYADACAETGLPTRLLHLARQDH